jgi:hypothetical protein
MQYPFSDGQVIVMEGSVENGKQWWLDVPGTPCALAAECACSGSLSASKGETGMWFIFNKVTGPPENYVTAL